MDREELLRALRRLMPETGSLCCLGCGYENSCSVHGCAVIRAAVEEIEKLAARQDQKGDRYGTENVPFCNGKAELAHTWVKCPVCHAYGPIGESEESGVKRWNTRIEPPNPPLTVDELRKVDREPVWLKSLADGYGEWVLFEQVALEGICDFAIIGGTRQYDGKYGKDWLAYRRKPEEGTT